MNQNWRAELERLLFTYAIPIGGKVIGAIVLWIVGRMIISGVIRIVRRGLEARKVEPTLVRYAESALSVLLSICLVLAILSIFGVETTSFAGILAAAGIAIGMAWSGLLSNFAAGIFMVILRPFKVGDAICAGGVTGDVREIGLFATVIDSPDNIRTIIGNSKIFADTIQNFSANPHRRVELKAQLPANADPVEAAAKLRERLAQIPNVVKDPAPFVEIVEFSAMGPVLAVRSSTHNSHYGDVYFAMQVAIYEVFSKAGYPQPEQAHKIRQVA
jgi:small conductance mechanosensitive channel